MEEYSIDALVERAARLRDNTVSGAERVTKEQGKRLADAVLAAFCNGGKVQKTMVMLRSVLRNDPKFTNRYLGSLRELGGDLYTNSLSTFISGGGSAVFMQGFECLIAGHGWLSCWVERDGSLRVYGAAKDSSGTRPHGTRYYASDSDGNLLGGYFACENYVYKRLLCGSYTASNEKRVKDIVDSAVNGLDEELDRLMDKTCLAVKAMLESQEALL